MRSNTCKRSCIVVLALTTLISQTISAGTSVLQPSPGANDGTDDGSASRGKDGGTAYNAKEQIHLYNSPCNIGSTPGYFQFSLNNMPTSNVLRATISLYATVLFTGGGTPWSVDPMVSLRQVTSSWTEFEGNINPQPSVDTTALDSIIIDTVGGGSPGVPYYEFEGWLNFDITRVYTNWISGTTLNYGVQVAIDTSYCANGNEFVIKTSDNMSAPLHRPKLTVTFLPPASKFTAIQRTPQGIHMEISGTLPGTTNWVLRADQVDSSNWSKVAWFAGTGAPTNWVDTTPPQDGAFYRVSSE